MHGAPVRVIPPPLLMLACLFLGALLQSVKPVPLAPYSFDGGIAAGVLLILLAAALGGFSLREMKRHGTTAEAGHEPSRLVTTGPFRFTRNPLYLSLVTLVAALSVMTNSVWLALSGGVLLLLLDRLVVRREESLMSRKFPGEYGAYSSRVRRWL